MSYYNTTHLIGGDLKEAQKAAKTQEEVIKKVFIAQQKDLSPSDVWYYLLNMGVHNYILTSVRRAMTNLTDQGVLIKTDKQRPGPYGKPEYCWRLRTKAEQQKLFV